MMRNKFILKISILNNEECTLIIDIVQWDYRFISNNNLKPPRFCYFQDTQDFVIYSQNDGQIFENGLEIPEYKHMFTEQGLFTGSRLRHDFWNDDKRFLYLKGLYRCLNEWAINWDTFKNDVELTHGIVLNSNYWIK